MLNDICVPVQNQELDCQGHVSLSVCVQWLERWLFVLCLILEELLTIIVKLAFHNLSEQYDINSDISMALIH